MHSHINEIYTWSNSTTIPTTQHHLVSPMHLRNCKMFTLLVILASLLAFPQLLGLWGNYWNSASCTTCFVRIDITLISESRFKTTLQMFFRVGKTFGRHLFSGTLEGWFPIHDSHHHPGCKVASISDLKSCIKEWQSERVPGLPFWWVAGIAEKFFGRKILKDLVSHMFHDLPILQFPFCLVLRLFWTHDLHEMFIFWAFARF